VINIINMKNIKVKSFKTGIDVIFKDGTDLFISNSILKSLKATSKKLIDTTRIPSKKNEYFILEEH